MLLADRLFQGADALCGERFEQQINLISSEKRNLKLRALRVLRRQSREARYSLLDIKMYQFSEKRSQVEQEGQALRGSGPYIADAVNPPIGALY